MASDNPWRLRITILTLAHVLGTLNLASLGPMALQIRETLGLDYVDFGTLASAYTGCQIPGSLLAGTIADRISVGMTIALSLGLIAVAGIVISFADGLPLALVGTGLMGVGYSFLNPATARGVLQWFPAEYRATAMGMKQTGVPLGYVLGAGNGILVTLLPWQTILWGNAVVIGLGALASLVVGARNPPSEAGARRPPALRNALANRDINLVNGATALWNMGQQSFFFYLVSFLREAAAATQTMASTITALAHVGGATGRIAWGIVSDRLFRGRRHKLLLMIGVCAGISLLAMSLVGPGWRLWIAVVLSVLLGLTIVSFAGLTQASVAEAAGPAMVGNAIGFHMFVASVSGMVGPPAFGWILERTDGDYAIAWSALGIAALGGSLLLLGIRPRPAAGH